MAQKGMSAATAKRRGYVLDNSGTWRKKTVLEKYYDEGYLDLVGSPFKAEQRKLAGEILAHDYYLGNYENLQSVKIFQVHIRTTGNIGKERALYYKERYLRAIKNIPYEFWPTVYKVCIEDTRIDNFEEKNDNSLRSKNKNYCLKVFLCMGLERLLKYYLQKDRKKFLTFSD